MEKLELLKEALDQAVIDLEDGVYEGVCLALNNRYSRRLYDTFGIHLGLLFKENIGSKYRDEDGELDAYWLRLDGDTPEETMDRRRKELKIFTNIMLELHAN